MDAGCNGVCDRLGVVAFELHMYRGMQAQKRAKQRRTMYCAMVVEAAMRSCQRSLL